MDSEEVVMLGDDERYAATAADFSSAFDRARGVGLEEFSWRGSHFHTRRADETEEQWREKMKAYRMKRGRA